MDLFASLCACSSPFYSYLINNYVIFYISSGVSDGTLAGISIAGIFGLVAIVAIISYCTHRRKALSTSESLQKMVPISSDNLQETTQDPCDNNVTVYTVVPPGHEPPYPLQSGARYIVHQHPPPPYPLTRKDNQSECYQHKHSCQADLDQSYNANSSDSLVPLQLPSYSPSGAYVSDDCTLELISASNGEEKRLLTDNSGC